MTDLNSTPLNLTRLRAAAPGGFTARVLDRVGIVDEYVWAEGPGGLRFAAWNPRGVSFVALAGDEEEFDEAFHARFDRPLRPARKALPGLRRALETNRPGDDLRFDLAALTPFSQRVLAAARTIPYGQVRSYGWVAREAGNAGAVRATGTALGRNPVPLLIPCHRVVRSDGQVGQYAFGPERKRDILAAEGVDLAGPLTGLGAGGLPG